MKKVSKKLQSFIDSISNVVETTGKGLEEAPKSYVSKVDGSYLTFVGLENDLKYLMKYGISEQIQSGWGEPRTSNIGFNPIEEKWYGWSHRAIFGFEIGSKCKEGNVGFVPSNKEEFSKSCLKWYGDTDMGEDTHKFDAKVKEFTKDGVLGVLVEYTYDDEIPNKSLRGKTMSDFEAYPENWGKGEWTANTLEEAKEMAIDFAKSVS